MIWAALHSQKGLLQNEKQYRVLVEALEHKTVEMEDGKTYSIFPQEMQQNNINPWKPLHLSGLLVDITF